MFEDLVDETANVPVLVVDEIRLGRFEPEDGSTATPLLGLTGAFRPVGQTGLQEGYVQSLALTPGRLAMVVRGCYLLAREFGGDYLTVLADTMDWIGDQVSEPRILDGVAASLVGERAV